MKYVAPSLLAVSVSLVLIGCGETQQEDTQKEVNVYSYRQPFLIEPMLNAFTEQTGIKVNVQFAKEGLLEKLKQEGQYSPADVLLTLDIARLKELADNDLTQAVNSTEIDSKIPANFRDENKNWFALTMRDRGVYSSKERVGKLGDDFDYLDLAKPEYKGRICTRSAKNPYNLTLIAGMIANHGEEVTKIWLTGLKENLARKPQGNDRAQVKAIKEGLCDLSLGNGYYLGAMMQDPEQATWAEAVYYNYPGKNAEGTHINVTGMAMAKNSPNRETALQLMEFLASDEIQKMYADVNYEVPVNPNVSPEKLTEDWGDFTPDPLPLVQLAENRARAIALVDEVQFDL